MRHLATFFVCAYLLSGCTIDRIEHDTDQALGAAHLENAYSIERSSRWRVDDPDVLEMTATYDASDQRQVGLLRAAYAGVSRIYPQTVLEQSSEPLAVPNAFGSDVPLRMHVDVASGSANSFPVALIDERTGYVIDRATLSWRPGVANAGNDSQAVADLFAQYAAQLRRRQ